MKKAVVVGLLACLIVLALPGRAKADWPVNVYLRLGVITDNGLSFKPFLWTLGANFDFSLSSLFFISADVDAIVHEFNFSPVWLTPSVMANLRLSAFYVGAGISKFFVLGDGYELSSSFLFKANVGLKEDLFKLQVFIYSPLDELASYFGVGLNFGFGF
jgi:hypothetical protein